MWKKSKCKYKDGGSGWCIIHDSVRCLMQQENQQQCYHCHIGYKQIEMLLSSCSICLPNWWHGIKIRNIIYKLSTDKIKTPTKGHKGAVEKDKALASTSLETTLFNQFKSTIAHEIAASQWR